MQTTQTALDFQNQFFAMNMRQTFNREGIRFLSDEYEPAIIKWLHASGKM